MKLLYLDCSMGAAGDMLCAALYELLDDEKKKAYLNAMAGLDPENVSVVPEKSVKCGITGTHMSVLVKGHEEGEHTHEHEHHHEHEHGHEHEHEHHHEHEHEHEHEHHHEHEHGHEHHHHEHADMAAIEARIAAAPVSEKVRGNALEVYRLIAEAESAAHGAPVSQIHFHEVGTLDALADILGFCVLLELLAPDRIVASPVCTGFGHVHCAHGILPVPAPATFNIMRGAPCYAGRIESELLTPTGAALLKSFVSSFEQMPAMCVERIGYGMGKKDLPQANCVRAILGTADDKICETLYELSCNTDDMTGERVGFALERLLEEGAPDAWWEPIGMKKSRPGVKICVLCRGEDREKLKGLLFRMTSTLGVRETEVRRTALRRTETTLETALGQIRVKEAEGYGTVKRKFEYEDLARIARERGLAIDEVAEMADKGLI